jgi:hypothetical protein
MINSFAGARRGAILLAVGICLCAIWACSIEPTKSAEDGEKIVKIEMNLDAFGVESDDFPSIKVLIDFVQDTSLCTKSFYNPKYKGSTYVLTANEMDSIVKLLRIPDLEKVKKKYESNRSDQPRSIAHIYTTEREFTIDDYGLDGDYPLGELYRIAYKCRSSR